MSKLRIFQNEYPSEKIPLQLWLLAAIWALMTGVNLAFREGDAFAAMLAFLAVILLPLILYLKSQSARILFTIGALAMTFGWGVTLINAITQAMNLGIYHVSMLYGGLHIPNIVVNIISLALLWSKASSRHIHSTTADWKAAGVSILLAIPSLIFLILIYLITSSPELALSTFAIMVVATFVFLRKKYDDKSTPNSGIFS